MNYNKEISDTCVRIGEVRFSFLNVFEPRREDDGTPGKYDACIIIPKKDARTVAIVEAAIKAAMENGKAQWGGKVPAKVKSPLRDGDIDREDDEAFRGCWFINAGSKRKPGLKMLGAGGGLDDPLGTEDLYSGCYGAAVINFYPYGAPGDTRTKGAMGVGAGLNNILKTRDGERLSGGRSAEEDFADLAGDDDGL